MKRRDFIKSTFALSAIGSCLPTFLLGSNGRFNFRNSNISSDKIVIFVKMNGGNDGFATFSSTSSYFRLGGLPFTPNNAVGHVTALGPVTSQALKWQGAPWNNYGSSATIHACPVSGQNSVEFNVNPAGPTETYRGTLTNNAFHNLGPIMTFSVMYRVY